MINVDARAKKHHIRKKDYIWNRSTRSCENGKYFASITDNSVIKCDEIIDTEEITTIQKNIICETKSFYILNRKTPKTKKEKRKHLLPY